MAMEIIKICFVVVVLAIAISVTSGEPDCVYSVYVKTGSIIKGGTNSNISTIFYESSGTGIWIKNLVLWGGARGIDYDYFERGNVDIFTGAAPCLRGPICALNLTSDGTGRHPGWNCKSLEVTTTGWGRECAQQTFQIDQWLADDVAPYSLSAFRNYCYDDDDGRRSPMEPIHTV